MTCSRCHEVASDARSGTRPVWDFPQPEAKIRWLAKHCIKSITHHYRPGRVDGGHDDSHWILADECGNELRVDPADNIITHISLWGARGGGFGIKTGAPSPCQYAAESWFGRLSEIDAYDRRHAEEMAEYRRLREKFAGMENE